MATPTPSLPHVVIIGGGFAGLACARRLRREQVRVTLFDSSVARSTRAELDVRITSVIPMETPTASWRIHLTLDDDGLRRESFFAYSSLTADRRVPITMGPIGSAEATLDLPRVPMAATGDDIAITVHAGSTSSLLDRVGSSLYLRFDGQTRVPIDLERYLERADLPEEPPPGGRVPPPPELAHVPPWDNPAIRPEDREYAARWKALPRETEALGTREASLVAANEPGPSSGCQGGNTVALGLGLAALLLALTRRRGGAGSLVVVSVLSSATPSEAKIVYGHVSFWDSREDKSNLPGSRLRECVTTNTTCGAPDGETCCFRPLPYATVYVVQNAAILASMELNANGFFVLGFTGDDAKPYSLHLRYQRLGYPGNPRLVTAGCATPPLASGSGSTSTRPAPTPASRTPVASA